MKTLFIALVALASCLQMATAQIQKNTKVQITMLGVPPTEQTRINGSYQVDQAGNIRMWEIGTIKAAGLTVTSLAKKVESAYKAAEIYTSPTIQIQTNSVVGNINEQLTVSGSVQRPGAIAFAKDMTLAQALAAAGGPTAFGTTKRVTVYREGKRYKLSPLTNDKHKLERVFPSDTIEVDQVKPFEKGGR